MIATRPADLRARLKNYLDSTFSGNLVIVYFKTRNKKTGSKVMADFTFTEKNNIFLSNYRIKRH